MPLRVGCRAREGVMAGERDALFPAGSADLQVARLIKALRILKSQVRKGKAKAEAKSVAELNIRHAVGRGPRGSCHPSSSAVNAKCQEIRTLLRGPRRQRVLDETDRVLVHLVADARLKTFTYLIITLPTASAERTLPDRIMFSMGQSDSFFPLCFPSRSGWREWVSPMLAAPSVPR